MTEPSHVETIVDRSDPVHAAGEILADEARWHPIATPALPLFLAHRDPGSLSEDEKQAVGAWRYALTETEEKNCARLSTVLYSVVALRQWLSEESRTDGERVIVAGMAEALCSLLLARWDVRDPPGTHREARELARHLSRDRTIPRGWREV
jgi:hypothetical protein